MTRTAKAIFPEKYQILSGSALKLIAVITMLIDHTGSILLSQYPPALSPLFELNGRAVSLYRISRDIGRVAFPIFCFLLVEGFLHTRDRKKYGINLFLFACISELPWNFMHSSTWFYDKQNVFFTLLLGYLAFCAIERFQEKPLLQLLCVLALLWLSSDGIVNADYGWKGYIFLLIMYWLRNEKPAQAVVGSAWLYYEWKACFAFISINLYNGRRGFIRGKAAKYFFYAFYPVHITLLVILRRLLLHI